MIVESRPRMSGKTFHVAKYMTEPGNGDVVCITPTNAQADIVFQIARKFDPTVIRSRFITLASFQSQHRPQARVVIDEADGVISQAVGAEVELIALTEAGVRRNYWDDLGYVYPHYVSDLIRHQIGRLENFGDPTGRLPGLRRALDALEEEN